MIRFTHNSSHYADFALVTRDDVVTAIFEKMRECDVWTARDTARNLGDFFLSSIDREYARDEDKYVTQIPCYCFFAYSRCYFYFLVKGEMKRFESYCGEAERLSGKLERYICVQQGFVLFGDR